METLSHATFAPAAYRRRRHRSANIRDSTGQLHPGRTGKSAAANLHFRSRRDAAARHTALRCPRRAGQGDRRSSLCPRHRAVRGRSKPMVLCAVDWVGVGNSGHIAFRDALAKAAGTTADRVAVHCLHQHDAPGCDFQADEILAPVRSRRQAVRSRLRPQGHGTRGQGGREGAEEVRVTVTHVGVGKAKVTRSPPIAASWGPTARSSSSVTVRPRIP